MATPSAVDVQVKLETENARQPDKGFKRRAVVARLETCHRRLLHAEPPGQLRLRQAVFSSMLDQACRDCTGDSRAVPLHSDR